jgi:hypothetical protein
MNKPIKIWENDHSILVQQLMDEIPLAPGNIVRQVITAAYMAGWEPYSDGISCFPQLDMQGYKIKHPLGVGHDYLYWQGMKSPFLPSSITTEHDARKWCDEWFNLACKAFGHPIYATIFWFCLRVGAQKAWDDHRKAGDPRPITPQENPT